MKNKIEVMSPVGSYESLMSAIKAGADSVYFGVDRLNMRARSADNFTLKDMKKISSICIKNNMKSYLTLNTILYDFDMELMKKLCNEAKKAKITAIIANDISAIQYANSIGLKVHISTQANVSNIEAVKFYSKYSDVIVLARELALNQIEKIINQIKTQKIKGPSGELVKIELFVHGALCVAISGKCYMSLSQYGASANRGLCLQSCRRAYKVIDEETGDELKVENKYIMSPKDLCTIGFIDKLINAGVSIFKIEGRGRGPEYVYTVTKAYKEASHSVLEGTYTKDKIKKWNAQLESVYNRGFWQGGYYLGKKLGEWSGAYGSKATKEKVYLGQVSNYFAKNKVASFVLEAEKIKIGDDVLITGPTTGVLKLKVKNIHLNGKSVDSCSKGEEISFPVPNKVRKNDKLYLWADKIIPQENLISIKNKPSRN